jgi:hypothetical protein
MTGVPPSFTPFVQETAICYAFVIRGSLLRFKGESGKVKIMAPFPVGEEVDVP